MLIFIDYRSRESVKQKLTEYGTVIEFSSGSIVDNYLSGHPDIFLCQTPDSLITAPNLAQNYFKLLTAHKIKFSIGKNPVQSGYPDCAIFNAVVNSKYKIHKTNISDSAFLNFSQKTINVNQGMTRCSLISLNENNYITSDRGIEKNLISKGLNVCYVSPENILLPGQKYGLIGGCAGTHKNKIFFNGSINHLNNEEELKSFILNSGFEIIELDNLPLFDGGGIIFLDA